MDFATGELTSRFAFRAGDATADAKVVTFASRSDPALPAILPNHGDPGSWAERRVILPAGWRSIEVERLWVRGRPARLVAADGATRVTLELGQRGWMRSHRGQAPVRRLQIAGTAGTR